MKIGIFGGGNALSSPSQVTPMKVFTILIRYDTVPLIQLKKISIHLNQLSKFAHCMSGRTNVVQWGQTGSVLQVILLF